MMNTIASRSRAVHADRAQGLRLSIIPILGPSYDRPAYGLLNKQSSPLVKVTEVTEGGSVPELCVQNDLDEMLFLMDGQELVGAKQNRILNTDVLAPARSKITIPVSCVEARRWRYTSAAFAAGKTASHRVRSSKHARVHQSLKQAGRHDADQSAVWDDVNSSLASAAVNSPTSSMHDAYEARKHDLDAFRSSVLMPAEAVGLAVFRGGMFFGLDLFDRHTTLKHYWDTIVDSYMIDAFAGTDDNAVPPQSQEVAKILEAVAAGRWESFRSPGVGQDWRLEDTEFSGSALLWENQTVVHLQVFAREPVLQR